jgi:2'-5' RNA ligase
VAPRDVAPFLSHLRLVAARNQPFPVRLQGTGTFRPVSPVVFVKVERGAGGCDILQQQIRSGPVKRPLEFPFHPHVTVAHNLDELALDHAQSRLQGFTAVFDVAEFCLYEQGPDDQWRSTDRFELATRPN